MSELLIEIGVEEIPAGYVEPALDWMQSTLREGLVEGGLAEAAGLELRTLASPRRLTVWAAGVRPERPLERVERTGPRKEACFDAAGEPTKALLGFARGAGVEPGEVTFQSTEKGEVASATVVIPGQAAVDLLPELATNLIARVPFPKSMHWVGREHTFCRPVRSLVVLFDDVLVPVCFAGVDSGRAVHGHPFLAAETRELASADLPTYVATLAELRVAADAATRRQRILDEIDALELSARGLAVDLDEELLDEVVNLVEWPGVQLGDIDEPFLELPEEVIIEPMKVQQRYFPVRPAAEPEKLAGHFLVVHNRGGAPADSPIAAGNSRVLQARLADARFFFDNDRKHPLEELLPKLEGVVFRKGQGTMRDKAARLERLSGAIARALTESGDGGDIGARSTIKASSQGFAAYQQAARAGLLAKADLATEMVYEFPALQGAMGRIYAEIQGEHANVAAAIGGHYGPRVDEPVPGDPSRPGAGADDLVLACVSLADKLDNLVSATLAKSLAKGSKDPFATRRDAIAVLRTLFEARHRLRLSWLIEEASAGFEGLVDKGWQDEHAKALHTFLEDRLTATLREAGRDHEHVAAVLATDADDVAGIRERLETVEALAALECWPTLVEAVERTANITKKWKGDAVVKGDLLQEDAERDLHAAFEELAPAFEHLVKEGQLVEASKRFADALAAPLGRFFEDVLVNHEDPAVRDNRMSLVRSIHDLYAQNIADLSKVNLKREGGRG